MADNKWINNNDSWEVSTDVGDYFGVDTSGNPSFSEDISNHFSPLDFSSENHAFSGVEQQAKGIMNGITTIADGNQYINLGTSVLNSVSNASYDIVRKIFESFTQTQEITISSLMQEIAPYAMDFKTAGKALGDTALKYLNKFTNINEWLGSFVSDVMNDSSVVDAISGLSIVQTYAATLNTATEVINGVEKVIQVINPLLPIVRMVSNFALAFWSGGSTAAEESTNIMDDLQKLLLQLSSGAMFYIKKYAYGIKIKVPKILISSLNAFSVKNAVNGFDMNNNWAILTSTLFNDDYYNTAMIENSKSNTRGTAWLKATEDFYNDSLTWTKEQIKTASTLGWQSKDPDSWWSRYRHSFVTGYMSKAISKAKANVYSTSYQNFDVYINKIKKSDYGQDTDISESKEKFINTAENTWNGIVKVSSTIFNNISGAK